jgi:hypothetical protein
MDIYESDKVTLAKCETAMKDWNVLCKYKFCIMWSDNVECDDKKHIHSVHERMKLIGASKEDVAAFNQMIKEQRRAKRIRQGRTVKNFFVLRWIRRLAEWCRLQAMGAYRRATGTPYKSKLGEFVKEDNGFIRFIPSETLLDKIHKAQIYEDVWTNCSLFLGDSPLIDCRNNYFVRCISAQMLHLGFKKDGVQHFEQMVQEQKDSLSQTKERE